MYYVSVVWWLVFYSAVGLPKAISACHTPSPYPMLAGPDYTTPYYQSINRRGDYVTMTMVCETSPDMSGDVPCTFQILNKVGECASHNILMLETLTIMSLMHVIINIYRTS